MNIDSLAESIVLCKEEQDFYEWIKNSGNINIHFGDSIKIKNELLFAVGGTINGTIYCQKIDNPNPKNIRYNQSLNKIILHWKTFLYFKNKSRKKVKLK